MISRLVAVLFLVVMAALAQTQVTGTVTAIAKQVEIQATVTRPANTTQYTAGQTLSSSTAAGTYLTFVNACAVNGGSVDIIGAMLFQYAYPASFLYGTYELYLFNYPPVPINDAATFNINSGDLQNLRAILKFGADTAPYATNVTAGTGGSVVYTHSEIMKTAVCYPTRRDLYGLVKVTNAYLPPGNSEMLTFMLRLNRNN